MQPQTQRPFADRLLSMPDGRSGLRGAIHITASAPGSAGVPPASLDFVSSDDTLDRYNEIICPTGWKLDNYLRNPVFQNSHQYGDIMFTLGKALITEVRSGPSTINSQPSTYWPSASSKKSTSTTVPSTPPPPSSPPEPNGPRLPRRKSDEGRSSSSSS